MTRDDPDEKVLVADYCPDSFHTRFDCNDVKGNVHGLTVKRLGGVPDRLTECQRCERMREKELERPSHNGGYLSADLLYPDCQNCGSPGTIYVTRSPASGVLQPPFWCLKCETGFEAPQGSPWRGIFDVDKPDRKAYIDMEIREITAREQARAAEVSEEGIKSRVQRARERRRSAAESGMVRADD